MWWKMGKRMWGECEGGCGEGGYSGKWEGGWEGSVGKDVGGRGVVEDVGKELQLATPPHQPLETQPQFLLIFQMFHTGLL